MYFVVYVYCVAKCIKCPFETVSVLNRTTLDRIFVDPPVSITSRCLRKVVPRKTEGRAFSDLHRQLEVIQADGSICLRNVPFTMFLVLFNYFIY